MGRIVHVSITNPVDRFAAGILFRQGPARADAHRQRLVLRDSPSGGAFRPGRHSDQQHRLGVAKISRCLSFSATASTVCSRSSWTISPNWPSSRARKRENFIINAIGPETFTYRNLVRMIGQAIGKNRLLIGVPPSSAYWASKVIGRMVGDVLMTREEIRGLMANLLYVKAPPAGETKLSDWVREHAAELRHSLRQRIGPAERSGKGVRRAMTWEGICFPACRARFIVPVKSPKAKM